tara:strand:+ start:253 stop:474 length:222 start_codon:yes stop_codon:yes gene_type:complete
MPKKDFSLRLGAYTSTFMMGIILVVSLTVMVVNFRYIIKMDNTINTMWHEIEQVKETNISLFQFIEEHKGDFN